MMKNSVSEFATLVELVRARALEKPSQVAYTFLADGEVEAGELTFLELDRQARAIAARLRELKMQGQRALLLYPSGLEFIAAFLGCLYAGVVAVPAFPPRKDRVPSRLLGIVQDCRPVVALTIRAIHARVDALAQIPGINALQWLATDAITDSDAAQADTWQEPPLDAHTLAFLQYTSGSTGSPKGVMVSHGNLLHNEEMIRQAFEQSEDSVVVGWLPLQHDMGLIGNVLQPLYLGATCVLMSPQAFLQRPLRWLETISRYRGTTSGGPNFAYDLCTFKIGAEERSRLDLSSWTVAFSGAEPVRAETLRRFAAVFASCGFDYDAFYPCYGLAETTLFVTGGWRQAPPVVEAFDAGALEANRVVPALPEEGSQAPRARARESDPPAQVPSRVLVGCGKPWLGQRLLIVDPESRTPCPVDQVGEIWVSGPSVAQGYWEKPETSEHDFRATLATWTDAESAPSSYLRTGDLGFLCDGELYVTGRLKDLIIIRGRNHYPQDIELSVERSHPAARPGCGAAFSVEIDDEERLVVAQELKRRVVDVDVEEVAEAARRAVAEEHEVQIYEIVLLKTGSIPKTSSGKIQRHACRASYLAEKLAVVGRSVLDEPAGAQVVGQEEELGLGREDLLVLDPADRRPILVAHLRREVARVVRISASRIDDEKPLTHFGLDSLMAVELRSSLEVDLGISLPLPSLLEGAGIAQLADEILRGLEAPAAEDAGRIVELGATEGEHALSCGQQALWFLQRLAPESAAYNIAAAVRLRGELDPAALRRTFERLVDRHPSLRTSFSATRGEPVQRVHGEAAAGFEWVLEEAGEWDRKRVDERLAGEAYRPFDLERRLLRVVILRRGADEHLLLLVVHHAVADFWSLAVLVEELGGLYPAERNGQPVTLAPVALRYTDFVRWQSEMLASPHGESLEVYWRRQLAGGLPVLNLPTDRPRPPVQTWDGAARNLTLAPELTRALNAMRQAQGATLYMTLLAAFQTLLFRYTGQDDVLVGSPSSGRNRPELAGLVGYFVNPLVLRGDLAGDPSFAAYLTRVRRTVLDAFLHQDYPFDRLVERLQPERDPSRSPIFQVMLTLQQAPRLRAAGLDAFTLGQEGVRMTLGGLEWESVALPQRTAPFDLTLVAAAIDDALGLSFQYNRDLFDAATIDRMLGHFQCLLESVAANVEQPLSSLNLLSTSERRQLLVDWNATRVDYPRTSSVHQLVEAQTRQMPERVAIVFDHHQLSYGELDRRAERLAQSLRHCGVAPEIPVGICMTRSPEMVVGLLGILKAGGAYVPLDPAYPDERLAYMIENAYRGSATRVLLTEDQHRQRLGTLATDRVRLLCLDNGDVAGEVPGGPTITAHADNLAYVIYTSGSTGKPKGVQIPHRGVVNFLNSMRQRPGLGQEDTLVAVTTLSFDISVLEIFLPLVVGARLALVSRETVADGGTLGRILGERSATAMQATPATWRLLLETGWRGQPGLKVLTGGEALPVDLAARLVGCGSPVWNMYGPTETTIWSATGEIRNGKRVVTLGGPIDNTRIHILDPRLDPVPVGVVGEVFIGGDGLSRGYLHAPRRTAERFIPDPFDAAEGGEPGGRLYRVGDLARYRHDGDLEFLGRVDHQVKVRGFRIELGEIETVLTAHSGVAQAVVMVREDTPGDQRLVAYLVSRGKPAPRQGELRSFLHQSLPDYMVPTTFVFLDTLPLTANHKVDRRALPVPQRAAPARSADQVPRTEIERTIAGLWREVLGVDEVGVEDNFFDLGGHSLLVARLHSRLAEALGRQDLTIVDLFRYPTISALARFLAPEAAAKAIAVPTPTVRPRGSGDVAIIGMAGRFPGARNLEEFWWNLRDGVESISFFSAEELAGKVDPALLEDPDYVRARGILDDVEEFDAAFFGFNPREAEVMDPQHRLFLECSWEALEDAGYDSLRYPGRIGVFAGVGMNTYLLEAGQDLVTSAIGSYQAFIGNDKDFVPTRVSYKLNLRGPSINVQTACSSSLVAVHLACQSLADGESDMVLAGGITIRVPQFSGYLHQQGAILSPDGHCRAFDAGAAGTVQGNGVGIVVLKRLADALADGDPVRAVIKGSAINNDGANKIGYTAPSVEGQAEVIAEALRTAGVAPQAISYLEAHGTGTELGDPIEATALRQVFTSGEADSCAVGSVKTNIGHLDTAAGVAGVIKTVLALEHRQIPPSLHFESLNPRIDFSGSPFYVNATLRPWENESSPRRAGVSSFGIGGTNAHIVLEEAPAREPGSEPRPWKLLLLSARTASALEAATDHLVEHLRSFDGELADVAYTLQVGRRSFDHRRMVVASDLEDARETLASRDPERVRSRARTSASAAGATSPPVAFLFSGQGAQYLNMGRELYASDPAFRADVDRSADLLEPHLGRDLRSVIYPELTDPEDPTALEEATRRLEQTRFTQPALFVIEYALARRWMEWGIRPQEMIGHSIGEYVAACLAGVFSLEDALALVAARGRLVQAQPPGTMLAVALSEEETAPLVTAGLSLAAVNGPTDCVVSGTEEAIAALERRLEAREVRCRRLHTSHAFHSEMMQPAVEPFIKEVERFRLNPPQSRWISNLTGARITDDEATDPAYWGRHLAGTMRFGDGIRTLVAESPIFLEVGPGRTLITLARRQARALTFISTLPHPQDRQSDAAFRLDALGRLWLAGAQIDWQGFYRDEKRLRVSLPPYPFERQRYWLEPTEKPQRRVLRDPFKKKEDLAEWFYAPSWKQSFLAVPAESAPAETWFILGSGDGLARRLSERLAAGHRRVILAVPGEGFAEVGDGAFTIDPRRREDYETLSARLGGWPSHIVHAWTLEQNGDTPSAGDEAARMRTEKAQERGVSSLLLVLQALATHGKKPSGRLTVLTGNLRKLSGGESLRPENAPLVGLLKVVPQEFTELVCRTIDVVPPPPGSPEEEDLLEDLERELRSPTDDEEVAYRGGVRWVRSFEPLRLESPSGTPPRLRQGGAYLLTGGLGGIGLELAAELARTVSAKLVLVDRQVPPPRESWEAWISEHGEADLASRQIARIRELEKLGAEVLVAGADVTDEARMREVVEATRERFGPICGVIHAAGLAGGGILRMRSPQEAAAILAPKVQGTVVLRSVLAGEPLEFIVLCSSINAVVGGFGQGDYCAANAFLDAFAESEASRRGPQVVSLNWDRWQGVGMSSSLLQVAGQAAGAAAHPLLGVCVSQSPQREVYRAEFTVAGQWVLEEHRIAGRPTVPGATYLEMVRAAFAERAAGRPLEIREAVFLEPLVVDDRESREVLTVLDHEGNPEATEAAAMSGFRIVSRRLGGSGERPWQEHARGKVGLAAATTQSECAIAEILARCGGKITSGDTAGGDFLVTGRRWQNLERVAVGDGELLAELALPEDLTSDLGQLALHPALLDVGAGYVQLTQEGNYLPLAYEQLRVYGALPCRLWSHVTLRGPGDGETISCDVALLDEAGSPRVLVDGFSMRRISDAMKAELARRSSEPREEEIAIAGDPEPSSEVLLAGSIAAAEGAEVLRRVLASPVPPQLVVSPRDLDAVAERYRTFDPTQMVAELDQLDAPRGTHARPELGTAFVAPAAELEKQIAEIWQRLLGIDQVGVHDNFFELGGTSLIGVQVVAELKKQLRREIATVSIFEAPTIHALAKYLQPPADAGPAFGKTRERASKKKAVLERARQARSRPSRRPRA